MDITGWEHRKIYFYNLVEPILLTALMSFSVIYPGYETMIYLSIEIFTLWPLMMTYLKIRIVAKLVSLYFLNIGAFIWLCAKIYFYSVNSSYFEENVLEA